MSYRNPRFSYRHMLREYKALGIHVNSTNPISGLHASLYDDRSTLLVKWLLNANGNMSLAKQSAASSDGTSLKGGRLNRIIIPSGHNMVSTSYMLRMDDDLTPGGSTQPMLSDGVAYLVLACMGPGMVDLELNSAEALVDAGVMQIRLLPTSLGTERIGYGELWWTDTVQPTTGIAVDWEDTTEGVYDRSETRSGARYTQKRGRSKWRGNFTHRGLSGADLKLYDDLYRYINYGQFPFWYEHPDSADALLTFEDWSAWQSNFILTGGGNLQIIATRPDGQSGNHIEHRGGTGGAHEWKYPVADAVAPTADWNNKVLRVQVKPDYAITDKEGLQFFVESVVGGNTARTYFEVGYPFHQGADDVWYRLEIDMDAAASVEAVGTAGPADLSNLSYFGFYNEKPDASQIAFGDFILVDKAKQPRLVEVINYQRFQDSPLPSGALGPTYSISMQLLEVTT